MKNARIWVFLAIVVALVVCNFMFGWSDAIASGQVQSSLQALLAEHPGSAAALYVVLTVVGCAVLALPGALFALTAGAVFGALWGTVLCWFSVTVGACAAFLMGRFFLRDALKPKLAKSEKLNALLFEGAPKSDVYLLAITRLVPVFPYNLQNFAYGITDIGFAPYALYSAVFMIPGTAVYTLAAAGILDEQNRFFLLAVAAVLLVLTLVAAWALKRRAHIA